MNKEIKKCRKCRLWKSRKNTLSGEGNPRSRLMLIAQAPGEKEDRKGKMFIGPSGKKLDELDRQWYDYDTYWDSIRQLTPKIDELIVEFNERVGLY